MHKRSDMKGVSNVKKLVDCVLSVFTAAVLFVSAFTPPELAQHSADLVEATETIKYTIEDIKNLQDFLLAKETPDLSGKDYDLCKDGVWNVFDLCLMKQHFLKQTSSERNILIAYFTRAENVYLDKPDKHFTTSSIYSNSNLGKRCDILAPAEDVFSCISSSKYVYETGTSMAAPHVSGVAAMVWAADNLLTGAEVKQIVCSAQNTNPLYNPFTKEASDLKWRVLDAEKAVKSAVNGLIPPYDENVGRITIKIDNDKLNPSPENGGILGYVVDSYDQKELTGVAVTAIDEKGKEYTVQMDSEGHFELVLPQGVYTIKATKAGCIETVLPETYAVKPEEVITLKENILLESVESALINAVIDNESVLKDSSSEMWFQDLNFDGQNELIVGNMFRYEVYTYVNNSLHKVTQQGNVNENWHSLYNMKLCYNAESEKYVGITRIGITMWVGMFETSYENDKLKFTEIVSMNEGDAAYGVQSTWYNGAGDEITESEYVELYNNYFKNLTEVAYTTDSIMPTDYDRLTRNEKFNRLKKSYEAFQIGENIGGFEQISVSTPEKIIYSKENLNTYDDILSMYHHYISTQ